MDRHRTHPRASRQFPSRLAISPSKFSIFTPHSLKKIPLVSPNHPHHLPHMIKIKTHFGSTLFGVFAAATLSSSAQVRFSLSSTIDYRQTKEEIKFRGGSFNAIMVDGLLTYFCDSSRYYQPGVFANLCSPGTSAFLFAGSLGESSFSEPYFVVNTLSPAVAIEPFQANLVNLTAAPASTLPRPAGGFKDSSASVYYNLHTSAIEEFNITRYTYSKDYTKKDREKFNDEIVPGVYRYIFPRLVPSGQNFVFSPAPVEAVINPMVEGFRKLNNQEQGVRFTTINTNKWSKEGFIELSYFRPNVIKWEGLSPTTVFAGADSVFISLRALRNSLNPQNSDLIEREAIFPSFDNDEESRVLLSSPFQNQFTLPPIFPSGTRGMIELQVLRDLQTGAATFDFSSRKFQIPVIVVNRYTDFVDLNLATSKQKSLLDDPDGDGYNNLTEWILDSNGSDRGSIPLAPVPAAFIPDDDDDFFDFFDFFDFDVGYFGFDVPIQRDTVPSVKYILQRSFDQGKTWEEFKEGYYLEDGSFTTQQPIEEIINGFIVPGPFNWSVQRVTTDVRGVSYSRFEVRSGIPNPAATFEVPYIQPPGTLSDIYRVKIVLQKKKKDKNK